MKRTIAIVGRPNVGKSTLFNRLVGSRKAIVDDFSGVTRDRHYGLSEWCNQIFNVIDTGGYVSGSDDIFESEIRRQVNLAIKEADVILFMVDVITGITDLDESVAALLRKTNKPVLVVVNKVDHSNREPDASVFYALGFDKLFSLSSQSGSGTGELLDEIIKLLPNDDLNLDSVNSNLPRIALVGKPNVGKSTLLNALLGEERTIVTPIAGTTRDTIHSEYNLFGHHFLLIDTAGLRKKSKVHEDIEFYSVMRTVRTIEEADVCMLMIDAQEGMQAQDVNIFRLAEKNKKGIVILVNKWDLISKDTHTAKTFESQIKEKIAPFVDVPIIFISAIDKQRVFKTVEAAMHVYNNRIKQIKTSALNDVMQEVLKAVNPPSHRGKFIKIKYVTQLKASTPTFAFFCNHPKHVKEPYKRYLENKLREHFDFAGATVSIFFREK